MVECLLAEMKAYEFPWSSVKCWEEGAVVERTERELKLVAAVEDMFVFFSCSFGELELDPMVWKLYRFS